MLKGYKHTLRICNTYCFSTATVVARTRLNTYVDCIRNVMAHAQKPEFVIRRNGRVHLDRRGRQFSRLLAAEVCASAVVILDTPCSQVVWRLPATHSICQFPVHFPSRASPCAITFQLDSTLSVLLSHIYVASCMQKFTAYGGIRCKRCFFGSDWLLTTRAPHGPTFWGFVVVICWTLHRWRQPSDTNL